MTLLIMAPFFSIVRLMFVVFFLAYFIQPIMKG